MISKTGCVISWLVILAVSTGCITQPTPALTHTPMAATPVAGGTLNPGSTLPATQNATALPPSPTTTLEAPPPTATLEPTQPPLTHTVAAGETLFRIALNNGVTVDALRAANDIVGDTIYVGQVLVIPSAGPVTPPTAAPTAGSNPPTTPLPTVAGSTATTTQVPATTTAMQWNTSSDALIIRAHSNCCELMPYNGLVYIPEAQVWGDGHIIWSVASCCGRSVYEGYLSQEALRTLLQRFVDAGFFGWEDNYQDYLGASLRPTHLTVNLTSRSKMVTELRGAPEAYYQLADFLKSGAGVAATPYIPTRGYLTAALFGGDPGTAPEWPEVTAGFTLDQVGAGRYIEGEALQFAWARVNNGPNTPVYAQSGGQLYVIMIQVPGVSFTEPSP